jgi:hypothetical protein
MNPAALTDLPLLQRDQLSDELSKLFGIALPHPRSLPANRTEFVQALADRLDTGPAARRELIQFLASEPNQTTSLIEDLAEILFLPRQQRSEYVHNRLPSAPWNIKKLLLEYALWSNRLDRVQSALTKGFCADHCDRLPIGCCSVLGYDMGLVPEAMLEAQKLEAETHTWQPPAVEDKCKYHSDSGCCLALFKSPACAGMLCDAILAKLRSDQPAQAVEAFLEPLALFRNHVLDRDRIFELMRETVEAGQNLTTL